MDSLISELDMAHQGAMEKARDANHPGNPEDDFTDAMLYKRARDRLAALERDLLDDVGQDRSQDTNWLRAGFLQRGAEIEQLEDGIRALVERWETVADKHELKAQECFDSDDMEGWSGSSAAAEHRRWVASEARALLREDGQ